MNASYRPHVTTSVTNAVRVGSAIILYRRTRKSIALVRARKASQTYRIARLQIIRKAASYDLFLSCNKFNQTQIHTLWKRISFVSTSSSPSPSSAM